MSVERLAELMRGHQPCVVLTGAGISTESGIPDFRSPTGIWRTTGSGLRRLRTWSRTMAIARSPTSSGGAGSTQFDGRADVCFDAGAGETLAALCQRFE